MSTSSEHARVDLSVDSPLNDPPAPESTAGGWLPARRQMADALRLRIAHAAGPDPEGVPFARGTHTSMRQGLGLIVLVGLASGLPGLITLWIRLATDGTVLTLLRAQGMLDWVAPRLLDGSAWAQMSEQIGGLAPRAPFWLAALVSALSVWLQLPLRLLTVWIVYGLLVLIVAKLLGAGATLPRFYAVTSYAALPLLLNALAPLPWIGPILTAVALLWALVAYAIGVACATFLDLGRSILCIALPAAILAALYGLFSVLIAGLLFL